MHAVDAEGGGIRRQDQPAAGGFASPQTTVVEGHQKPPTGRVLHQPNHRCVQTGRKGQVAFPSAVQFGDEGRGRDPHAPAAAGGEGTNVWGQAADQSGAKPAGLVEYGQPTISADPEPSGGVSGHSLNSARGNPIALVVVADRPGCGGVGSD